MLTFDQIKELTELVAARGLEGLELERAGFRLEIQGQKSQVTSAVRVDSPPPSAALSAAPAAMPAPAPGAPAPEPATEAEAPESGLHTVTSPIVGTFYRAASPESDAFVEVGDRIEKGSVLCIIEAMKLMNEIEADLAGEVVEILPKNAQAVEFGEPLFVIRPA